MDQAPLSKDKEKLLHLYRLLEDDTTPVARLQLQALAGLKNKSESAAGTMTSPEFSNSAM